MVIHSNNDYPFISVKTHDIFKHHKRYVIIFYLYKTTRTFHFRIILFSFKLDFFKFFFEKIFDEIF
jgi:hypothetical protein